MSNKRELVILADIGLVGTFSQWIEKATEKNYRYLEYVPLNAFPPKRVLHPVAIHEDHIHVLHSAKSYPGVENRIIFVYTGESGSLVKGILEADNIKIIEELREKLRKAQMQVATTKQSEEDARSGVNKTISNMKQLNRATQQPSPFGDTYGRPFMPGAIQPNMGGGGGDYDDFDNY